MKLLLQMGSTLVPKQMRKDWLSEWTGELWHVPANRKFGFCLGALADAFWLRLAAPRWDWWNESNFVIVVLVAAAVASVSPDRVPAFPKIIFRLALAGALLPVAIHLGAMKPRCSWFFVIKTALALSISMFGVPFPFVLGDVLALRWAILEEQRRCPVCLRRLTKPATMGQAANTVLDWYGTELMCTRGHGLMYVPEFEMLSYQKRRWVALDPSWSGLFRL